MKVKSLYALLVFVFYGCATHPSDIHTVSVSPLIYQSYTCNQILMEADRVSRRTQQLYASLESTADTDDAQMTIGLLLFWPALFFLDGSGGGPQGAEYARLKGESEALQRLAITKNCQIGSMPNAGAEIAEAEKKKKEAIKESQTIDEDACSKYGEC